MSCDAIRCALPPEADSPSADVPMYNPEMRFDLLL